MLKIEPAEGFMHIRQALPTELYHQPSVPMLSVIQDGRKEVRGSYWTLEMRWKHPRAEECLLIAINFVAQASLELTMLFKLAPKLVTPIFLSAGIMGIHHSYLTPDF